MTWRKLPKHWQYEDMTSCPQRKKQKMSGTWSLKIYHFYFFVLTSLDWFESRRHEISFLCWWSNCWVGKWYGFGSSEIYVWPHCQLLIYIYIYRGPWQAARTYIQQLCEDTGCCSEDLPEAMNDRKKWRERVTDICATSTTWWWWYIYIYR